MTEYDLECDLAFSPGNSEPYILSPPVPANHGKLSRKGYRKSRRL